MRVRDQRILISVDHLRTLNRAKTYSNKEPDTLDCWIASNRVRAISTLALILVNIHFIRQKNTGLPCKYFLLNRKAITTMHSTRIFT